MLPIYEFCVTDMTFSPLAIENTAEMYYNSGVVKKSADGRRQPERKIEYEKNISKATEALNNGAATADSAAGSAQADYSPRATDALLDINSIPAANLDAADAEYQKKAPVAGEEVAILHTNYGDISIKFFPEVAPKAVYSFIALAKSGRYDATIFHRIINGFMIQGGDYTNFNGTGGVSAYGQEFELEISDYLSNIAGAVAIPFSLRYTRAWTL